MRSLLESLHPAPVLIFCLVFAVAPLPVARSLKAAEAEPGAKPAETPAAERKLLEAIRAQQERDIHTEQEQKEMLAESERLLRKLIQDFPRSQSAADAAHDLVNLLLRQGRLEEAVAAWKQYGSGLETSEQVYGATRFLVDLLAQLGRPDDSMRELESYLKTHKEGPWASDARVRLARLRHAAGQHEMAVDLMREELERNPDVPGSRAGRLELVMFRIDAGQHEVALKELEAFSSEPESVEHADNAGLLTGYALERMGRTEEALVRYRTLQKNPASAIASQGFVAEGDLWHRKGKRDEAVRALEACLEKLDDQQAQAMLLARLDVIRMIGEPAPDFELTTRDGQKRTLASYAGKHLLLDFWATWCVPCYVEIPRVAEMKEQLGGKGLEVLGISLDQAGQETLVDEVVKHKGITWPVAVPGQGADSPVCRAYRFVTIPHYVLVGPDGKLINAGLSTKEMRAVIERSLGSEK